MSGPPREKLHTHNGEEEHEAGQEVYLRDGRKLVVSEHAGDQLVEIRNESGMVEVRIRLTEQGPVLQMDAARVSLALELCAVADGRLDGHVQFVTDEVAAWDYLAGALVCAEAGALVADAFGRDLVDLDHSSRRTPVAAGDGRLLSELLAARRDADGSTIEA